MPLPEPSFFKEFAKSLLRAEMGRQQTLMQLRMAKTDADRKQAQFYFDQANAVVQRQKAAATQMMQFVQFQQKDEEFKFERQLEERKQEWLEGGPERAKTERGDIREEDAQAEQEKLNQKIEAYTELAEKYPALKPIIDAYQTELKTGVPGLVARIDKEMLKQQIRDSGAPPEEINVQLGIIDGIPLAEQRGENLVAEEHRKAENERIAADLRELGVPEEQIPAYLIADDSLKDDMLRAATGVGGVDVSNKELADIQHKNQMLQIAERIRLQADAKGLEPSDAQKLVDGVLAIQEDARIPQDLKSRLIDSLIGDTTSTDKETTELIEGLVETHELGTATRRLLEGFRSIITDDKDELSVLSQIAPLLKDAKGPEDIPEEVFGHILEILAQSVDTNLKKGEVIAKLSEAQAYVAYNIPKVWDDYKQLVEEGIKTGKWEMLEENVARFTGDTDDPELVGFNAKVEFIINAWVRTESGAAITPEEVQRLRSFLPSAENGFKLNVELFRAMGEIAERNGYRDYMVLGNEWGNAIGQHMFRDIHAMLDEIEREYSRGMTDEDKKAREILNRITGDTKDLTDATDR